MNTPTLTSYEESIAPWNQKEGKLQTYFVTANISIPFNTFVTDGMTEREIRNQIYSEMQDELRGWDIDDLEITDY